MESEYNKLFDYHVIDTSFLAITPHYLNRNWKESNYGLEATARSYGIDVDKEKLHGAMYDVKLCRDLYRKAIGI